MSALTDWMQAVGTVGAFGGVLWELRKRRQDDRRTQVEALHRAAGQARLVRIRLRKVDFEGTIEIGVQNLSQLPIVDVQMRLRCGNPRQYLTFDLGHVDAGNISTAPADLGRRYSAGDLDDSDLTETQLTFMDAGGLWWVRLRNEWDPERWNPEESRLPGGADVNYIAR